MINNIFIDIEFMKLSVNKYSLKLELQSSYQVIKLQSRITTSYNLKDKFQLLFINENHNYTKHKNTTIILSF